MPSNVQVLPCITLLQAMRWIDEAWDQVSPSTVRHCWIHAGIVPSRFLDALNKMDERLDPVFISALTELENGQGNGLHDVFEEFRQLNFVSELSTAEEFVKVDDEEVCMHVYYSNQHRVIAVSLTF